MRHDIRLNIHYSAPKEIWETISDVYRTLPYWHEDHYPHWIGDAIDLCASVEPGGIQISGVMPETIWNTWYDTLKKRLTETLGYAIGEPEAGYPFKYWEPFQKQYSEIESIDHKKIVFHDQSTFFWEQFERRERDITATPPYFVFCSPYITLRISFDDVGPCSKKKRIRHFHDFLAKLNAIGITTLDLS